MIMDYIISPAEACYALLVLSQVGSLYICALCKIALRIEESRMQTSKRPILHPVDLIHKQVTAQTVVCLLTIK